MLFARPDGSPVEVVMKRTRQAVRIIKQSKITDRQLATLILQQLTGMYNQRIADVLHVSLASVSRDLRSGRARLKEALDEEELRVDDPHPVLLR